MKKMKKIAALVLAGAMAMTAAFGCGDKRTTEEKIGDALLSLTGGSTGLVEELGMSEIMESLQTSPASVSMEFTLEDTLIEELEDLISASVNAEVACDYANSKIFADLGVDYADVFSGSVQFYVDDKQVAVKVPDYLDKVFYLEFENIAERYGKSVLAQIIGEEVDMNAIFSMSTTDMDTEAVEALVKGYMESGIIEDFKSSIEYEEVDKEKFELDGKNRKCEGYNITISEDEMINFVRETIEYFLDSDDTLEVVEAYAAMYAEQEAEYYLEWYGEDYYNYYYDEYYNEVMEGFEEVKAEFQENGDELYEELAEYISDIEAEMYVYDGAIAYLAVTTEISDGYGETVEVGIELECTGGEFGVYDNYEFKVKAMGMSLIEVEKETNVDGNEVEAEWSISLAEEEDLDISWGYTLDTKSKEFEASVVVDDGYDKVEVACEGTIEVEKKKSVKFDFDSITLAIDDEVGIELSGSIEVECNASVDMPSGEKFDVLTENQAEWEAIISDLEELFETFEDLEDDYYYYY
ncbi:MAG: hypothetical protein IJW18_04080 [Lachnospiraceae bacterium]|nr:hypothetical protein [Lachnospiraceae bacterium]